VAHWVIVDSDKPLGYASRALMLPHHGIDGQIAISECNMKPFFAISPIST
jgi:hypothetical protein